MRRHLAAVGLAIAACIAAARLPTFEPKDSSRAAAANLEGEARSIPALTGKTAISAAFERS